MKRRLALILAGLMTVAAAKAAAVPFTLNFAGLANNEEVLSYYNGGLGSLGSGPGPNYGITFTPAFEAIAGVGPYGTPPFVVGSVDASTATMNVAGGFSGPFSFYYEASNSAGTVTVWSGLNGTGTMLADLPLTAALGWNPQGQVLAGSAMSVVFSGTGEMEFDEINDVGLVVPEPWSLWLAGTGVAGAAAGLRRRLHS